MKINIKRLHEDAVIPAYAKAGDAGVDLISTIDVTVYPEERTIVSTGIAIEIPLGYVGLIHPRSGLALNYGLSIVNTPGTIDAGYRGEIKVIIINHDKWAPHHIAKGDKIAQLVIQKVEQAEFIEVTELSNSDRNDKGFGSTGK